MTDKQIMVAAEAGRNEITAQKDHRRMIMIMT